MPELGPQIADEVLAHCRQHAGEAAAALERGLQLSCELIVGEGAASFSPDEAPPELDGPGLLVVLEVGQQAALVAFGEAGGILPDWYRQADPTQQAGLDELAGALGPLLLPEALRPATGRALAVENLKQALAAAGVAAGAARLALQLKTSSAEAALALVFPAGTPQALAALAASGPAESPAPEATSAVEPTSPEPSAGDATASEAPTRESAGEEAPAADEVPVQPAVDSPSVEHRPAAAGGPPSGARPAVESASPPAPRLPPYTQSLLRIKVPVTVTLASSKQSARKILELVPGSIIQFEKSCDEMLDLEIGNQRVAVGEAVKVGDKFGLRVNQLVLPDERFFAIRPQRG